MKRSVNLVSGNRYYRAGEEIPDNEVPAHAAKWVLEPEVDPPPIAPPLTRPRAEKRPRNPSKR